INLPGDVRKVLRSSGKIQLTPEGKLHRVVGAVQDVTELKSAEERLRLLVAELESRNSELQSFNYVASHDLQEPLRKIQLLIDRIRNGSLPQQAIDDYLARIDNAARRMTGLIQSLLMLSSFSNHEDEMGDVDLNVVLDHCKTDFERIISEKNATIQASSLPVIRGSEFQIRQLFSNLVNNSLKFSNADPRIAIDCRKVSGKEIADKKAPPGKDYWRLTFTDNGIGFDPQYKDKIFELFQRLYSKQQFAGTGIGLNIVKRIVERHHGFIEATSEPGKGARFDVWLPC
ncbi:MAG TPA: ATP-binding protein, partial [Ohtaekwangia sp.]|nr:ATP-binding protein [Ohtaekwangia sp.]